VTPWWFCAAGAGRQSAPASLIRRHRAAAQLHRKPPHLRVCSCVFAIAVASTVLAAGTTQSPVSSRKLSNELYELTVTLQNTTDVFAAQGLLIPEARKVCGGQLFQFGHYSFASTENISNASGSPEPPTPHLTLRQEVACGPSAAPSNPHTSYDWAPAEADSQLVAARTQGFLAQKDKGELAQAYTQFSDGMRASARFDTWSKTIEDFNAKAGLVEARKILKVSWVKDPPGVDPGFYAAVDYAGRFQNITYECGYVAWYREASGRLTVVREEERYIDRESEAKMTPEALRNTLAKIGCAGG
jgi:hypothetical protein